MSSPAASKTLHVWTKLSSPQWASAWEERLHTLTDTSLVITEIAGKKRIRVEMYCTRKADAERVQKQFGGVVREVKPRNWMALSTPKIKPIKIRDRLLIVSEEDPEKIAAHQAANPKRKVIGIPVEMAFGTGDHPTTATCLRLLCDMDLAGKNILDLGCGTGILSFAARALGAKKVLGVDFDPHAVSAAKLNAPRNGLTSGITFQRQDVLTWQPKGTYDVILANIFADVLTASFPLMARLLPQGGPLILSGILDRHAPDLLKSAKKSGFTVEQVIQRGKWVTAIVRKK